MVLSPESARGRETLSARGKVLPRRLRRSLRERCSGPRGLRLEEKVAGRKKATPRGAPFFRARCHCAVVEVRATDEMAPRSRRLPTNSSDLRRGRTESFRERRRDRERPKEFGEPKEFGKGKSRENWAESVLVDGLGGPKSSEIERRTRQKVGDQTGFTSYTGPRGSRGVGARVRRDRPRQRKIRYPVDRPFVARRGKEELVGADLPRLPFPRGIGRGRGHRMHFCR